MTLATHSRSLLLLGATCAALGCTPGTSTPSFGGDYVPPVGDVGTLHCATAAWDAGDLRPVSLELTVDLIGASAALTYDRAHVYEEDDWTDFASRAWDAAVTLGAEDETLSFAAWEVTVLAERLSEFAGDLWTGSLSSEEFGEHDVVCWRDDFVADFTYDPESGDCLNTKGSVGLNSLPMAYVRASGDGQCGSFEGLILNEGFTVDPVLQGTDLRGADLAGAGLVFAHIFDGRFEGANLIGFEFGYALITGTSDAYTTWPAENCTVDDGALSCAR